MSGQSIEPCGTPAITSFKLLNLSSVLQVTTHET